MKQASEVTQPKPGGAGRKAGVPSKRYAVPTVDVVNMQDVPEPPLTQRTGIADALYEKVKALKPNTALKAEFETEQHADYVRSRLRTKAKEDKRFMSSSRSVDGRTRYFWLEKL